MAQGYAHNNLFAATEDRITGPHWLECVRYIFSELFKTRYAIDNDTLEKLRIGCPAEVVALGSAFTLLNLIHELLRCKIEEEGGEDYLYLSPGRLASGPVPSTQSVSQPLFSHSPYQIPISHEMDGPNEATAEIVYNCNGRNPFSKDHSDIEAALLHCAHLVLKQLQCPIPLTELRQLVYKLLRGPPAFLNVEHLLAVLSRCSEFFILLNNPYDRCIMVCAVTHDFKCRDPAKGTGTKEAYYANYGTQHFFMMEELHRRIGGGGMPVYDTVARFAAEKEISFCQLMGLIRHGAFQSVFSIDHSIDYIGELGDSDATHSLPSTNRPPQLNEAFVLSYLQRRRRSSHDGEPALVSDCLREFQAMNPHPSQARPLKRGDQVNAIRQIPNIILVGEWLVQKNTWPPNGAPSLLPPPLPPSFPPYLANLPLDPSVIATPCPHFTTHAPPTTWMIPPPHSDYPANALQRHAMSFYYSDAQNSPEQQPPVVNQLAQMYFGQFAAQVGSQGYVPH